MFMKPPCEVIVKKFLPPTRALVALELKEKYKLKANSIAKLIGTCNSAVSQYLHGTRGNYSEFFLDFPEIDDFVKNVSKKLYEKKDTDIELSFMLGDLCSILRDNKIFIDMYSEGKGGQACGICFKGL